MAFYHEEGGSIVSITIQEVADHFTIAISDNGVGFEPKTSHKKTSIGLMNTEQRLKQLFGVELTIVSGIDQVTTISFAIPQN
jgi:sensor histidine kinase YesM